MAKTKNGKDLFLEEFTGLHRGELRNADLGSEDTTGVSRGRENYGELQVPRGASWESQQSAAQGWNRSPVGEDSNLPG